MKEVNCKKCGEPIGAGFNINSFNSEFCEFCGGECSYCGEFDALENGRCYMCNETKL